MPWTAEAGATLLIDCGPDKHLHVVVLGPIAIDGYGNARQVVCVGFTSKRDGVPFDCACEVDAGQHQFVDHATYVAYSRARIERADVLEARAATGQWAPRDPCSAALLARIRAGVCASRRTRQEIRDLFGCDL